MQQSPLRSLVLLSSGLTATQWSRLLRPITIPTLKSLTVDGLVTTAALANFLDRHPTIDSLAMMDNINPGRPVPNTLATSAINDLSGPLSYIHAVCKHWSSVPKLKKLAIIPDARQSKGLSDDPRLRSWAGSTYIKKALDCLNDHTNVECLIITLPWLPQPTQPPHLVEPRIFSPSVVPPDEGFTLVKFLEIHFSDYSTQEIMVRACPLSFF
jgi:hypothetical protein